MNAQAEKWALVGVSVRFAVAGASRSPRGRAGDMDRALSP